MLVLLRPRCFVDESEINNGGGGAAVKVVNEHTVAAIFH